MGVTALVVQFVPNRKAVPTVAAPQPAAEPVPTRSWQPEPEFGPDDFAMDLAVKGTSVEEPAVAPTPIGLPPITTAPQPVVVHASAPEPIPVIVAPAPSPPPLPRVREPEPPTTPPALAPSPPPPSVAAEPLVAALAAQDHVPSDALTLGEIRESVGVLRVRNDHVHVDEPLVSTPAAAPVALPSPPSLAARTITVRAAGTPKPVPRKPPNLAPPASEWREPDPEAPRELLRELAEYWHVKYETEKKRHTDMASQYEDMLRRLERLEREAAVEKSPGRTKKTDSSSPLTMDDLSVEDTASKENGADLEERWDQRTTQIERFH